VRAVNDDTQNALHIICENGRGKGFQMVNFLLDAGVSTSKCDESGIKTHGATFLCFERMHKTTAILPLHGADPNPQSDIGDTTAPSRDSPNYNVSFEEQRRLRKASERRDGETE
jgi:ankyrin repeat protein